MNTEIFYKNPKLVIYVPGYLSGQDKQEEAVAKLNELYQCNPTDPNSPYITVFEWESVSSYAMALHNSIKASRDLISYLKELPCTPDVTVIGHSLGALVVANAFKHIPSDAYYKAKQVILLGAAIPAHANLKHICDITKYPVINVINKKDIVLSTLYRTFNDTQALGCRGSYCKHPDNYVELEVIPKTTEYIDTPYITEMANQLLDVTGHSSSRVYLDSLVIGNYIINS